MKNIVWINSSYEEELDDDFSEENSREKAPSIINTPFGIYKMDSEFGNPYRDNEVWQGSVNFDITEESALAIESVHGVEGLRIVSRYTFVVCIGILFDSEVVKFEIEKALGIENVDVDSEADIKLPEDVMKEVTMELKRISKASQFWHLYVFPNGKIRSIACRDRNEYEKTLKEFIDLKRLSYGVLLTSDNEGVINEKD